MDDWEKSRCHCTESRRAGSRPGWLPFTHRVRWILVACMLLGGTWPCSAYSLLTHEELVDILWKDQIKPLLLKRFPEATPDQLREAHAYA